MSIAYYFILSISITSASLDFNNQCIERCVSEMQSIIDQTSINGANLVGQLSWKNLIDAADQRDATSNAFANICSAYENVDRCLESCESSSPHSAAIRQSYAGLRFICVDYRNEFFKALPCLSVSEPVAMTECQREINQSLIASNSFSDAVVNKQIHHTRPRLSTLCSELTNMIKCIEPITRRGCGDFAAKMMLKFVSLGFGSFEQLYSQLGINDQLPHSCRTLIAFVSTSSISTKKDNDQEVESHQRRRIISLKSHQKSSATILINSIDIKTHLFMILSLTIILLTH